MRFLLVALVVIAGSFFFYNKEIRAVLDDLTEVRQIKEAETAAIANAEGQEPPAKAAPVAGAPAAPTSGRAEPAAEKKAAPAKSPAIQPVGTSKSYELPGATRR
jgi:hypothetical protein